MKLGIEEKEYYKYVEEKEKKAFKKGLIIGIMSTIIIITGFLKVATVL